MKPDEKLLERMTALSSEMVDVLLTKIEGDDPMPWESVVVAASMAIKAFGMLVGQVHQLDDEILKKTLFEAVSCGLTAKVKAVVCKTKAEFDELCAAQEAAAAQEGPAH
jgi:hypothetical protein